MGAEVYEVLSLAARWLYVVLGVLVVWRSFSWLRKDRAERHRRLMQLPDAGMIGEVVVIRGSDDLPEGTTVPLPYEGTLGFSRACDLCVPCDGVARRHLDFSFQPRLGLLAYPRHGLVCLVNGREVRSAREARKTPLRHGGRLRVGEAELKIRLFAGLDAGKAEDDEGPRLFGEPVPYGEALAQRTPAPKRRIRGRRRVHATKADKGTR